MSVESALSQGSLIPPWNALSNGVPIATMKTLNEIEPRQPILAVPRSIDKPGSYYLMSSLDGSNGMNGIMIACDDVKLDLGGFALNGTNGSLNGIVVQSQAHNITIENGVVRGWGGRGVDVAIAHESRLLGVTAFENGSDGLVIGENSQVDGCGAFKNGNSGIITSIGATVKNCKARDNGSVGISAGLASKITDCTSLNNGMTGIAVGDYCSLRGNTSAGNDGPGITVMSKCRIVDNDSGSNTNAAGIRVTGKSNRVENNNISNNQVGIFVEDTATDNLIIRNSASRNMTNFVWGTGGNFYGELVVNPTENFIGTPWANFDLSQGQ